MKHRNPIGISLLLTTLFANPSPAICGEPASLWLGWRTDPTTTMVVRWLSNPEDLGASIVSFAALGDSLWLEVPGTNHPLPHTDHRVNVVELEGLRPGAIYRFRVHGEAGVHRFRTLPSSLDEPVRFVEGGDLYGRNFWYNRVSPFSGFGLFRGDRLKIVRKISRQAAGRDPAFAVIGGDITYSDGRPDYAHRWFRWLAAWKEDMVTSDSLLVPIVPVIGNHEVVGNQTKTQWLAQGDDPDPEAHAPYYYSLFVAPDTVSYSVLDCGDYLSLVLLDSGHTHTVREQTEWLSRVLESRETQTYTFAVYHAPAYPSYRDFDGRTSRLIRQHWVPLFERARITAAFEHHDHTYKRTVPILAGQEDLAGVVYVGDGAWGRLRRPRPPGNPWYLARTEKTHHVFLTTLTTSGARVEAIDEDGEIFDAFVRPAKRADGNSR